MVNKELISAIIEGDLNKVKELAKHEELNQLFSYEYPFGSSNYQETGGMRKSYLEIAYVYENSLEITHYLLDELKRRNTTNIVFHTYPVFKKAIEHEDINILIKLLQIDDSFQDDNPIIIDSLKSSIEIRELFNSYDSYHRFHKNRCLFREIYDVETIEYLYELGLNINEHENSIIHQLLLGKNRNKFEVLRTMIELGANLTPSIDFLISESSKIYLVKGKVPLPCVYPHEDYVYLLKEMENFDDFNLLNNNIFG